MKDSKILLDYILESIAQIEGYTRGLNREQFSASLQVQDAVLRRLEVIGEAVKSLPAVLKDRHTEVPWRDIAGLRDILVHAYFRVDLDLVWKTLQEDMPRLREDIIRMLKELKQNS